MFVAAAVLAWWLLRGWLGAQIPLTLFVLAVAGAAWIGGLGPGLLATLAALVVANAISLQPDETIPITAAGYSMRLALFAAAGIAVSVISENRRRATARADQTRHWHPCGRYPGSPIPGAERLNQHPRAGLPAPAKGGSSNRIADRCTVQNDLTPGQGGG